MHKEKRLTVFKERIKGKQGVPKAIEAYKLVNDVLSEVEAEFAEHSEEKMTIPALTSASVQEYGRKGIRVSLIKHIILINYNGAFRIERIHEGTEFVSKASANGELFEAVENFKIVQPNNLKDLREKQGFMMHERLNQIWLNLVADDTTLSTPEEAITFLKSHFAKVEDSLPEDKRDNPSYRMMIPALTTEGVWKENGNNRYWEAFKERKVVIYGNGSIIIWEKDQVWFEKGDVPPLIKTNIDTPNINSVETEQRLFKDENEIHHVQMNRYKQYFFWLTLFGFIGLWAALGM